MLRPPPRSSPDTFVLLRGLTVVPRCDTISRADMIVTFKDSDTADLFNGVVAPRFASFANVGKRKLRMVAAAARIDDLRVPPGNRLEALSGDRSGQWSIRVNDQFRVCFEWADGQAYNVEIVDYH